MKAFFALSLIVATASAGLVPIVPTDELEGRITNGELAKPGEFPYQVGLQLNFAEGNAWCGGTLISNKWILTAAHCTDGAKGVTAYLGTIDIKNPSEKGQKRIFAPESNIHTHKDWQAATLTNDIALIKLPVEVAFNEYIHSATLPKKDGKYASYVDDIVVASGWGKDSDSSSTVSQFLRYIEVPVIKQSSCSTYYFGMITDKMICISGKGGKSTCNGDSGGPLVYKEGKINYVIGATSFGIALGCEKGWPGVFTRVTSYLDWIEEVSGVVNK